MFDVADGVSKRGTVRLQSPQASVASREPAGLLPPSCTPAPPPGHVRPGDRVAASAGTSLLFISLASAHPTASEASQHPERAEGLQRRPESWGDDSGTCEPGATIVRPLVPAVMGKVSRFPRQAACLLRPVASERRSGGAKVSTFLYLIINDSSYLMKTCLPKLLVCQELNTTSSQKLESGEEHVAFEPWTGVEEA